MVWLFDCFQRVGQRCTPCTQSRIIPAAPTAAITWLTVNTRSANSGTALTIHGEFCFLREVDTLKSHLRINIRSEFSDNDENSCQNWKRLLGPAIPENFSPIWRAIFRGVRKNFFGIASSRSVIGSGNSCHPLNQSENKPRTKRAWPLVFSRASGSLPVWTLKSDWLLVTFFSWFWLLCFHN